MSQPFSITLKELFRGLRPKSNSVRNGNYLTVSKGAVSREGAISAVEELTRIDTSVITDAFPFPQIFPFIAATIVCSRQKIYEWNGTALVLKFTADAADLGGLWTAVDFYDFVYLSNGKIAVVRDVGDKTYSKTTELPSSTALCNFNGQIIAGAPDCAGLVVDMGINSSNINTTITLTGTISVT